MPDQEDIIIARMKAAQFAGTRIPPKDENDAPFPAPTQDPDKRETMCDYDTAHLWVNGNDTFEGVRNRFAYMDGAQWWECKDGKIWTHSSQDYAAANIQEFLRKLHSAGENIKVTSAKVEAVLKVARYMLGPKPFAEFDRHGKDRIPLANGIYDLNTHDIIAHSPTNMITRAADFDYDPFAECPRWMQFLNESLLTLDGKPNQEWIEAMQLWFGYCLVPDVRLQTSMFWIGQGGNGKGAATQVLTKLVGPRATTAVPIEQLDQEYHRAGLQGKLVGLVNEIDPRAMLKNGNHFKAITGGDMIQARNPCEKVFEFIPYIRLVISCNEMPSTRDLSIAYFRRFMLIEWRNNVDPEQRDPYLDEKLEKEMPGIFNWALDGLKKLRNDPKLRIESPESERLKNDQKLDADTVASFIADGYEKTNDAADRIPSTALYLAYRKWCDEQGVYRVSQKKMGMTLSALKFQPVITDVAGKRFRAWSGIKPSDDVTLPLG